jgi:hypothetical protein
MQDLLDMAQGILVVATIALTARAIVVYHQWQQWRKERGRRG